MVNISERPAEADDRAVPGFWEDDLIIGKGNKAQIATLVERATRFVLLVKNPYDRTAKRVAALLAKKMETLPEFLRNSVTWDQNPHTCWQHHTALARGMTYIGPARTAAGRTRSTSRTALAGSGPVQALPHDRIILDRLSRHAPQLARQSTP